MRARRFRPVTLALGFVFTTGCTAILGIDGTYVIGGSGGSGHTPVTLEAGGSSDTADTGPAPTDTAVVPPPPPTDAGKSPTCEEGSYQGAFKGKSPLFSAPLSGTLSFQLVRSTTDPNEFDLQQGKFDGSFLGSGVNVAGSYDATLTGVLDCHTHKLTGQLVNGVASVLLGFGTTQFTGNLDADYDVSAGFTGGTWQEQGSSGGGTWTAAPKGP